MSRHTDRERLLQAAMSDLLAHPAFGVFIDMIRDLKEESVRYACEHTAVKDQREYLAAIGEVRAYYDILNVYAAGRDLAVSAANAATQDEG